MPIPKKARRVTLAVLAAAGALLISSCLEPPVSYSQTNPGADVADPSMLPFTNIFGNFTQVFGTEPPSGSPKIPTYTIDRPPGSHAAQGLSDALSSLPPGGHASWSPSVIGINGTYVMAYTVLYSSYTCLETAVAAQANGPYSNVNSFCSPANPPHNWIDPQLFKDKTNGKIYMLFSEQWPSSNAQGCGGGPNSKLWIIPMSSDGLATAGYAVDLLDWNQAIQIKNLPTGANLGATPCLENPAILNDSAGGYDLLFSIGTWNGCYGSNCPADIGNTYFTGEVGCGALNNSSSGCGFSPSGGAVAIFSGGGASTLYTNDPAGNYLMYANWAFASIRVDYVGPTSGCNPSLTACD